jgi:hypothetical protein
MCEPDRGPGAPGDFDDELRTRFALLANAVADQGFSSRVAMRIGARRWRRRIVLIASGAGGAAVAASQLARAPDIIMARAEILAGGETFGAGPPESAAVLLASAVAAAAVLWLALSDGAGRPRRVR